MPFFNSFKKSTGYTLIEILITITILSLVGIISIPNLRNYSKNQDLKNSASSLKDALSNAQSASISGIKCSTKPSVQWSIKLNPTTILGTQQGYQVRLFCLDPLVDTVSTPEPKAIFVFPSSITMSTTCSPTTRNIDIIFTGRTPSFDCNDGNKPTTFSITLTNASINKSVSININSQGVITN